MDRATLQVYADFLNQAAANGLAVDVLMPNINFLGGYGYAKLGVQQAFVKHLETYRAVYPREGKDVSQFIYELNDVDVLIIQGRDLETEGHPDDTAYFPAVGSIKAYDPNQQGKDQLGLGALFGLFQDMLSPAVTETTEVALPESVDNIYYAGYRTEEQIIQTDLLEQLRAAKFKQSRIDGTTTLVNLEVKHGPEPERWYDILVLAVNATADGVLLVYADTTDLSTQQQLALLRGEAVDLPTAVYCVLLRHITQLSTIDAQTQVYNRFMEKQISDIEPVPSDGVSTIRFPENGFMVESDLTVNEQLSYADQQTIVWWIMRNGSLEYRLIPSSVQTFKQTTVVTGYRTKDIPNQTFAMAHVLYGTQISLVGIEPFSVTLNSTDKVVQMSLKEHALRRLVDNENPAKSMQYTPNEGVLLTTSSVPVTDELKQACVGEQFVIEPLQTKVLQMGDVAGILMSAESASSGMLITYYKLNKSELFALAMGQRVVPQNQKLVITQLITDVKGYTLTLAQQHAEMTFTKE